MGDIRVNMAEGFQITMPTARFCYSQIVGTGFTHDFGNYCACEWYTMLVKTPIICYSQIVGTASINDLGN